MAICLISFLFSPLRIIFMAQKTARQKRRSRKGQLFIVAIVFLIGMIFIVQQLLFSYSNVDMSSSLEMRDAEIYDNILNAINKTLAESIYCNETDDSFKEKMERLKASFLEEHGREYSIEINYAINCSGWNNAPPSPAPLTFGLSIGRQGRDTRGNFQLYHIKNDNA